MTEQLRDWTVLITAAQSEAQPAITEQQSDQLLKTLGATDAWVQYPPASGRGHGFETRWWQRGRDAGAVAFEAVERYEAVVAEMGIDVRIVLVHVASPEDRLNETTIGLERRLGSHDEFDAWNVMVRAIAPPGSDRRFPRASLDRLLAVLPGSESSGFARDGMVEARFWVEGQDAVEATERGATAFMAALTDLAKPGWTIVRAHTTSLAESRRTAYLGVERRMLEQDTRSLTVAIHSDGARR